MFGYLLNVICNIVNSRGRGVVLWLIYFLTDSFESFQYLKMSLELTKNLELSLI